MGYISLSYLDWPRHGNFKRSKQQEVSKYMPIQRFMSASVRTIHATKLMHGLLSFFMQASLIFNILRAGWIATNILLV